MPTKPIETFMIAKSCTIKQAMKAMTKNGAKELFIVDSKQHLLGAISDGDIRKWILKGGRLTSTVWGACNQKPVFVTEAFDNAKVRDKMLELKIESVPVVDALGKVVRVLTWDEIFAGEAKQPKGKIDAHVVIMAGGMGSRLDPFTRILPKPLIPIGNKPIVEHIMDRFAEYGIDTFHLLLNHKSNLIKSYFQDLDLPYHIHCVSEKEPLGTAGGLKLIKNTVSDPFIVTNCDILIDADYSDLVKFHQENEYDLTLVVSYVHYVIPYGVCEIKNGGLLKGIKEKPEFDLFVNTGMYLINKSLLNLIEANKRMDMTDLIAKAKQKNLRIGAFPINEKSWVDVGQWTEYKQALEKLKL